MSIKLNPLDRVSIVLVEPAGPLNVGSVARVMKNMGLTQLVLVNPQCDYLGDEARKMAVHGIDVLQSARVVDTLPEALSGCQRAIATAGRDRACPQPLETPRTALPWLLETPAALIFGREDRGLTNEELSRAHRRVRIPTSEVYPSLNLAQSVAICAYELHLAATASDNLSPLPISPAPIDLLEQYYDRLETLLLRVGYLYPHTAAARMEKFRRLYNRAELSAEEAALLLGILRQVEWALSQPSEVDDTLNEMD
ncbi:MAG TPA: RNA methyltransferase [Oscillatoriales cyanobacterium M59_W2019_021]|nr:MAG: RNA methyltransferase [Cyanobacteria bacterium J055]HIK30556.1 RNA methyltransferase [Oscillatoriales cyanobacterium M4454_W2019_049]HIK50501.1 RNA methyltransferase [Oscillatoriales cyanobacterium M59_W2019_021]